MWRLRRLWEYTKLQLSKKGTRRSSVTSTRPNCLKQPKTELKYKTSPVWILQSNRIKPIITKVHCSKNLQQLVKHLAIKLCIEITVELATKLQYCQIKIRGLSSWWPKIQVRDLMSRQKSCKKSSDSAGRKTTRCTTGKRLLRRSNTKLWRKIRCTLRNSSMKISRSKRWTPTWIHTLTWVFQASYPKVVQDLIWAKHQECTVISIMNKCKR